MVDLIAREDHLDKLNTILRNAIQGRFQIVFVTGEAGVGKTALVTAFVEKAKHEVPELFIAGSKCYTVAGGQQEAYLPFWQILETLSTEKKGNATWDRLRRGMAELAPEWLQVLPGGDIVAAVIRTAQWRQREFGDQGEGADISHRMVQYTNALRLAAEAAPLLLWIDDLHWSDNATLDLISFLADHASDTRMMLVAAYRPTDIAYEVQGQPHPVRRLVSKLKRYQQCIELAVPHFTCADLEQFLAVRGYRFPEAFVERLWRQSGGNPLFIEQYVILLHKSRLLKRERGIFMLAQANTEIGIPDGVQDVIEQRLGLIGRDLRRLLSYASVQGERFASRVLAQLLEAPELDVLEKLNLLDRIHQLIRELEERHLIVKVGAEYQFIHALIQQVVYNDLSAGQRRLLHRAIAQLLESLYDEDAPRYATDLAIHFERGEEPAQAIHYYLQASRNALNTLALDDALTQAEAVRRLVRQVGEDERTAGWHIEALIRIAEAHYWKAEYEAVLAACDEGEALCKRGDFAEQRALFLYWRAMTLYQMGHPGDVVEHTRQALEILGNAPANRRLQGFLNARLGGLHTFLPLVEVQQSLDAALAIAEEHNLFDVKVRALIEKAWIALNRTDMPKEALCFCQEALTITQSYDMISEQVICHRLIAYACRLLKRGEEALSHNQQAVTVARQSGLPYALHWAIYSLAISWYAVREDLQGSLRIMREAIAVAEQYHFPVGRTVPNIWFNIVFGLGLWQDAEQVLERFRERTEPSYPRGRGFCYRWYGHIAYAHGLFEEAVKAYGRALAMFDKHSPDERDSRIVQPDLGLALLATGDLQRGTENLQEACDYWQDRHTYWFARSLRGLARADLARDDPIRAVARLREALAVAEEGRYSDSAAWPAWPHTCIDLGRALLATGETNEALQHALVGYGKFKRLGHFLLGDAAFVVGQILTAQDKCDEAISYLYEARNEWRRLKLTYHLPTWEAVMREHSLV